MGGGHGASRILPDQKVSVPVPSFLRPKVFSCQRSSLSLIPQITINCDTSIPRSIKGSRFLFTNHQQIPEHSSKWVAAT